MEADKNDLVEAGKREARVKEQALAKLGVMLLEHLREKGVEAVFGWQTPVEKMLNLRKNLREAGEEALATATHTLIMSRVKE